MYSTAEKISIEQMGDEDIAEEIRQLMKHLQGGSGLERGIVKQMKNRLNALLQRQQDIEKRSSVWRREQQQQAAERGRDDHDHGELRGQDILHLVHPNSSSRQSAESLPAYHPYSNSRTSKARNPGGFVRRNTRELEPLECTTSMSARQHKFEPYVALAALTTLARAVHTTSVGPQRAHT